MTIYIVKTEDSFEDLSFFETRYEAQEFIINKFETRGSFTPYSDADRFITEHQVD